MQERLIYVIAKSKKLNLLTSRLNLLIFENLNQNLYS